MDKKMLLERLDGVLKTYNVPLRHTLIRAMKMKFNQISNTEFNEGIKTLQGYYASMRENPNFISEMDFKTIFSSNPDVEAFLASSGFTMANFMDALHNPELQAIIMGMLGAILDDN